MECQSLNTSLITNSAAKMDFRKLYKAIDQEVVLIDKNNLLLPGEYLFNNKIIYFDFCPDFKRTLHVKFSQEGRPSYNVFDHMNREELEDYIVDKNLEIEAVDYEDEPLEKLVDQVKREVGFSTFEDDREIDELDSKFEHVGVNLWKPEDSKGASLSVYIQIESDDTNWGLVKDVVKEVDGKIILHHRSWDFNDINCRDFDLGEDLDPKEIAQEIVKAAEKIKAMAEKRA